LSQLFQKLILNKLADKTKLTAESLSKILYDMW